MTPYEELMEAAPRAGWWFHSIELQPGVWTNGLKSRETMAYELDAWKFPQDLTGKSVLDVGCADGGWSIVALRRGAASVLSIDEQMTEGMRLIRAANIIPALDYRRIDLFSDEFMSLPKFDFIIFAGVLYHVHDMLEALKRVRSRASSEVLLETHLNESAGTSPPLAVFYETNELNDDRTNWWGPNTACLEAMLRTCGFAYERDHLVWENTSHQNGRVSYRLQAIEGSISGKVAENATGSNPHLEWMQGRIDKLVTENRELRDRLDAHQNSVFWRVTRPLRAAAHRLRLP